MKHVRSTADVLSALSKGRADLWRVVSDRNIMGSRLIVNGNKVPSEETGEVGGAARVKLIMDLGTAWTCFVSGHLTPISYHRVVCGEVRVGLKCEREDWGGRRRTRL